MKKIQLGIEPPKVKGFTPMELSKMLKFLWNYESFLGKEKEEQLEKRLLADTFLRENDPTNILLLDKIKNIPENEDKFDNYRIICTGEGNIKRVQLLFHLRNAIAHSYIWKDDNEPFSVHFTDYNKKEKHFSAIGRMSNDIFEALITLFSNTKELK